MDIIKQRLLQYAKEQRIGMMKFYEKISVSQSNFSGKGAESALSTDKIIHILITFPDLNPDWLLLGKGEMLRQNLQNTPQVAPADVVSLEKYEKKVEECALLRAELNALKAQQPVHTSAHPYPIVHEEDQLLHTRAAEV